MKKIVIIDDEYFFRQALIKYVRNFKDEFTVVGDAGNGKLGIELIEQYHPEIILIDINMPQMTGFDVISYIQKQALQTRFIIISGYDKFEYAQKAIQMGVQDFLLKPITVESLYKSLRQTSERIDQEMKKNQNREVLDRKKRNYQNYMRHFAASQFVRKDTDREGMQKLASEVGYQLDASRHVAILYRVNRLPGNWEKTDYELYYFTVENVFCELLGEKNCCISYINFQKSLCLLVGMCESHHGAEWIRPLLKKTIEVCDPKGNLGTTAVIGGFYTEANQLYESYIEAFAMERKRCFYEHSGIFYVEDAAEEQQENGYLLQNNDFIQQLIADALDVNLQYMCFLFKKQTDTTIGAYILQTRMEMAGKLFQRTNYNVTEVAQKVGFFDVSYFSKCFKKYFGVSPKQYQNVSSNYLKTT